jgi:GNAT superfamily N-acetyltransferase
MQRADIPFAVRLANLEGWGIPARDFKRILLLDAHGSFIAMDGSQRVGLATSASFGKQVAWIGNVVVKERYRGKHIGQSLVEHSVRYLSNNGVKHIALYSFKENVPFYTRLGFVRGHAFARLRRNARPRRKEHVKEAGSPVSVSSILAIDRKAFGADRSGLLKLLLQSGFAWYSGSVTGHSSSYIVVKTYQDIYELGPWISFGLGRTELHSLLRSVLERTDRKAVEVACPLTSPMADGIMRSLDFQVVNEGRVMFYKRLAKVGKPESVLAYGFLDKG